MKILLRDFNNKEYAWFDAEFDIKTNRFKINDCPIYEFNIVAIHEDNRNQYVKCSVCGKSFKKGSEEITAHITPITDSSKCLGCNYLRVKTENNSSLAYKKNDDGSYTRTETKHCILGCARTYPLINIETDRG